MDFLNFDKWLWHPAEWAIEFVSLAEDICTILLFDEDRVKWLVGVTKRDCVSAHIAQHIYRHYFVASRCVCGGGGLNFVIAVQGLAPVPFTLFSSPPAVLTGDCLLRVSLRADGESVWPTYVTYRDALVTPQTMPRRWTQSSRP